MPIKDALEKNAAKMARNKAPPPLSSLVTNRKLSSIQQESMAYSKRFLKKTKRSDSLNKLNDSWHPIPVKNCSKCWITENDLEACIGAMASSPMEALCVGAEEPLLELSPRYFGLNPKGKITKIVYH